MIRASTMYAENNICNFEAMLRKSFYRFIQRLQVSDNLLIHVFVNHGLLTIYGAIGLKLFTSLNIF